MDCPVNRPPLHSHLPHFGKRRTLVEHYGLGILVCHLGHVTEDIFFCNNTKEAPTKRETERGTEIYHVHFWRVRRELTSCSVAKFCRKVPMRILHNSILRDGLNWRSDPESNLSSDFRWLQPQTWQQTADSLWIVEGQRVWKITQGWKRYVISMSRQHLHSEKQVLRNRSETEWVRHLIHTLWPWWTRKWS